MQIIFLEGWIIFLHEDNFLRIMHEDNFLRIMHEDNILRIMHADNFPLYEYNEKINKISQILKENNKNRIIFLKNI